MPAPGPDITRSALLIVDMQNDFLHSDGSFAHRAREHPEAQIDIPFLVGTIPHVQRLAAAFRAAERPVVYITHVLKPDYSDAAFPFWRVGRGPGSGNRTHCIEGTWGAEIIDELKPHDGEHVVVKKGFGGFANTTLAGPDGEGTATGRRFHGSRSERLAPGFIAAYNARFGRQPANAKDHALEDELLIARSENDSAVISQGTRTDRFEHRSHTTKFNDRGAGYLLRRVRAYE
jgi:hypothetical protein